MRRRSGSDTSGTSRKAYETVITLTLAARAMERRVTRFRVGAGDFVLITDMGAGLPLRYSSTRFVGQDQLVSFCAIPPLLNPSALP
jgi:hypothetical protein